MRGLKVVKQCRDVGAIGRPQLVGLQDRVTVGHNRPGYSANLCVVPVRRGSQGAAVIALEAVGVVDQPPPPGIMPGIVKLAGMLL
jgi:hypothetical protein